MFKCSSTPKTSKTFAENSTATPKDQSPYNSHLDSFIKTPSKFTDPLITSLLNDAADEESTNNIYNKLAKKLNQIRTISNILSTGNSLVIDSKIEPKIHTQSSLMELEINEGKPEVSEEEKLALLIEKTSIAVGEINPSKMNKFSIPAALNLQVASAKRNIVPKFILIC